MVVLQEEAENVHGDGRVEACGAREAVLALVGGMWAWVWRWAYGAGIGWADLQDDVVGGRSRGRGCSGRISGPQLEEGVGSTCGGGDTSHV